MTMCWIRKDRNWLRVHDENCRDVTGKANLNLEV